MQSTDCPILAETLVVLHKPYIESSAFIESLLIETFIEITSIILEDLRAKDIDSVYICFDDACLFYSLQVRQIRMKYAIVIHSFCSNLDIGKFVVLLIHTFIYPFKISFPVDFKFNVIDIVLINPMELDKISFL